MYVCGLWHCKGIGAASGLVTGLVVHVLMLARSDRACSLLATVLEEAVLGDGVLPGRVLVDQVAEQSDHLLARKPDLLGRVQLAQRDSVILERLLIHGHGEGDAALVSSRVALAHSVGAVVDFA